MRSFHPNKTKAKGGWIPKGNFWTFVISRDHSAALGRILPPKRIGDLADALYPKRMA